MDFRVWGLPHHTHVMSFFDGAEQLPRRRIPYANGPVVEEGRCQATWKREFKLPWREAGPPNHLDDKVDSDQ